MSPSPGPRPTKGPENVSPFLLQLVAGSQRMPNKETPKQVRDDRGMDFRMNIKSCISVVMIFLLLGCTSYPAARKEASPPPSKEMGRAFVREALQHYQFVKDPDAGT